MLHSLEAWPELALVDCDFETPLVDLVLEFERFSLFFSAFPPCSLWRMSFSVSEVLPAAAPVFDLIAVGFDTPLVA